MDTGQIKVQLGEGRTMPLPDGPTVAPHGPVQLVEDLARHQGESTGKFMEIMDRELNLAREQLAHLHAEREQAQMAYNEAARQLELRIAACEQALAVQNTTRPGL